MKNERRLRCWQHLARAAERTHCLGSSRKTKEIWKSTPGRLQYFSSSSLSLSLSSSPPLVTPQTESFLDGFPKLSGVRREALTQHCPLCMHGSSWVQPRKRAQWGGRREGRKAAALEPWLRQGRLYGKSQGQHWPRVSNNFCFLGRVRGVDGEKRQIEMGTQRGSLLHTSHRESCSQHSRLNCWTHHTWIPPVFHLILAIQRVTFE